MKCKTKYCRNTAVKRRNYCHKCRHQKWRENNMIKYCYFTLRNNARRRKKQFNLTFDEFIIFITQTQYMIYKGRTKLSLSIDRIDNEKGYTIDNIRAISLSENSYKRNWIDYAKNRVDDDCPF